MTDPEKMRGLTRLADDSLARTAHLLDALTHVHGDDEIELRVRFWATLMAKAQARYHDELLNLVDRIERS